MEKKEKRLKNYESNINVMIESEKRKSGALILFNNGAFNPDGFWMTANAVLRWGVNNVIKEDFTRFNNWVQRHSV